MLQIPAATYQDLSFHEGRHRPAMGLMPLAAESWIDGDRDLAERLALKRELLHSRRDEVLQFTSDSAAAADELLDVLVANLIEFHPGQYQLADGGVTNIVTGESWNLAQRTLPSLEMAARLVQEDFCLLAPSPNGYVLTDAALCFPSRWRLADKIGKPLIGIHQPVPDYVGKLAAGVDKFFVALRINKIVWRLNWAILDDPALFQPQRLKADAPITPLNAGDDLWLRVERQTLRRLPASGAVVFTIRTYVDRLQDVITDHAAARNLAATIQSMPEETLEYKHMRGFKMPLLEWLEARANT